MDKTYHNQRRANLVKQIANSGLTQSEFAARAGLSRSYLSQLLSAGFRFGEKAARSIEGRLNLPAGSLDHEDRLQSAQIEVWESTCDLPPDAFALVRRIAITHPANAGDNRVEKAMYLPPLAFRKQWLESKKVTCHSNLRVLEVKGDSMSEYLQDGDTVMIDTGQTNVEDNAIYVIAYGGELRIRRLSRRFDGGLLIRADNAKYPDEALSPDESKSIEVLGKMLWRGG